MLGIDKGADAAFLLGFGHDLQSERGFARRFRAINLDDAPARQTADAQRDIQAQGARGNGLDVHDAVVGAEPHDRALAVELVDLRQRGLERLLLVHAPPFDHTQLRLFHGKPLISRVADGGKTRDSIYLCVHVLFSSRNRLLNRTNARAH